MKATIVDLRYRMKAVLGALDRGETVTVYCRGKERAKLTPSPPPSGLRQSLPKMKEQPFFGIWAAREDLADPAAHVRRLREPRPAAKVK